MYATDGIVIRHVSLRGAAPVIESARAPIKTALEQAPWPTTESGEILIIRRIACRGNAREIAAHAVDQARRLALQAVDGGSSAANHAVAVRFRNHALLTASLIRDILTNQAPTRWFWKHRRDLLQLPKFEAVAALVKASPLALPTIAAQLEQRPQWKELWQQIDRTTAEELLASVAHATGWSSLIAEARAAATNDATNSYGTAEGSPDNRLPSPSFTFADAPADDPQPMLLALVQLWRCAPATLNQPSAVITLSQRANLFVGKTPRVQNGAVLPIENERDREPSQREIAAKKNSAAANDTSANASASLAETEIATNTPTSRSIQNDVVTAQQESPTPQLARAPHESERAEPPLEAACYEFITAQGGLFYLLNFLRLPLAQKLLLSADDWTVAGGAWRLLHDLARALDCPLEQPLLTLVATECGLTPDALAQQSPLSIVAPLHRLGVSRYGEELWCAATWRIPARIIVTPSHMDLHFRLNDARMAVRRAGLDLNPGWLPWFGKVVTFHYGSGLEPY